MRTIALAAWLSCLAASNGAAAPPGINLSWNDCGAFGQEVRTFACDTNTGSHTLVGSFASPVALDTLNGHEIVLDMHSEAASTPPWWQIRNFTDGTVGCRGGAIPAGLVSFDFTSGPFNCHDYWSGRAIGGWALRRNFSGYTNWQRILMVCAVPLEQAGPLAAGLETYSFKLVVLNTRTVGAGACAGCMDQAQIVFNSIKLTQPFTGGVSRDVLITNASVRNHVWWSPGVVATRNATWGAIKSMYR